MISVDPAIISVVTIAVGIATTVAAVSLVRATNRLTTETVAATNQLTAKTVAATELADQHHQETLAPLLTLRDVRLDSEPINGTRIMGTIVNVGSGPATNIRIAFTFRGRATEVQPQVSNGIASGERYPFEVDVTLENSSQDFQKLLSGGPITHFMSDYEVTMTYSSVFSTSRTTTATKPRVSDSGAYSELTTPLIINRQLWR